MRNRKAPFPGRARWLLQPNHRRLEDVAADVATDPELTAGPDHHQG